MSAELVTLLLLCAAAMAAGFIDAIVGGGGLIQTPASLVLLSDKPVSSVIATVKIPSFSGTALAARQYMKKVKLYWPIVTICCTIAFFASYAGSLLLVQVNNDFMKPVLLVVLSLVAIYTFRKKDFGQQRHRLLSKQRMQWTAAIISMVIGFYDGFIGPGTGSFLVLAFIALLGFDFLQASAHAKVVNLATNLGSITLFLIKGKILYAFALPMAVCNAIGAFIGARLAIAKGNSFIRVFFLIVVVGTLLRFAWDVYRGMRNG